MFNISWSQIEKNPGSKELNFESFCFQIAKKKYNNYGTFSSFYNTPGSEFYLELEKDCDELNAKIGQVIGWQAKFWLNKAVNDNSPLQKRQRQELIEGLIKSLSYRKNLKCWIICTPGKFSNTKPSTPWDTLKKELGKIKSDIRIDHWHKEIFESIFHENPEGYSSIFKLYFNSKLINKEVLNNITSNNLRQLEKKFDVDLHVKEESELSLLTSIYLEKAIPAINIHLKQLDDILEDITKDYRNNFTNFTVLSEDSLKLIKSYYLKHENIINEVKAISLKPKEIYNLAEQIKTKIEGFIENTEIARTKLNDNLKEIFEKQESELINTQDIIWLEFIIDSIYKISDLLIGTKKDDSLFKTIKIILLNNVHIFGAAGYGKTHFACSIAYNLIKKDLPVILILGSSFKNSITPKQRILQLVDIEGAFSFKDLLGAINTLGDIYNCKIPIIIDGLNEGYPSPAVIWNNEIYPLIEDIKCFKNIILITTCREKGEYIQQIFNRDSFQEVENYFYIKGLTDKIRPLAVEKYFNKYNIKASSKPFDNALFENPLRLKIFCEVNKNKENLDINLFSIVESIQKYIDELIKNISTQNCCVDQIRKSKLKKGLQKLGKLLWDSNKREILFYDEFAILFDEELTFALIDEGLCFQRDSKNDEEMVQFTYDLVGGFQIAQSVFFANKSESSIVQYLQSTETFDKLFSTDKNKRHPLHEDIVKSITYLLPLKIGKNIFEVVEDESILTESIGNIELFTSIQSNKVKFIEFISNRSLSPDFVKNIFRRLFDDVVLKNDFNSFEIISPILLRLGQFEIDSFWNEIIRKESFTLQSKIEQIVKNFDTTKDNKYNILLFILLLTGVTDKLLRNKATEGLMKLGLKNPELLLNLTKEYMLVNDGFIIESLICALTGVVLRLKNKGFLEKVEYFIKVDFLTKNSTNHIAILDYLQTIFDFGLSIFGIEYEKSIFYRNKNEKWILDEKLIEEINKDGFMFSYEMMDYDFIKYEVASLSNDTSRSKSKYTRGEIIGLLIKKIWEKGYDKNKYDELDEKIREDNKYRREVISEKVIKYSEKYLYSTYLELAGYLMINKQIEPEYKDTYRFSYIFYDPTFPRINQKIQILNDCILPEMNGNIQDWINKDASALLKKTYQMKPFSEESEMVLLYASLNQKNKSNDTFINVNIQTCVFNKKYRHKMLHSLKNDLIRYTDGLSQIFSGEIPWRNHIEAEDVINYEFLDLMDFNRLVEFYTWASWTQDRFQNSHFPFLNSKIANRIELDFNINELSHIDKNGKTITKLFVTSNSEFLFIERSTLEQYLTENHMDLIWDKYIQKYGEFSHHKPKKLNPSYNDFRSFDYYSEFQNNMV